MFIVLLILILIQLMQLIQLILIDLTGAKIGPYSICFGKNGSVVCFVCSFSFNVDLNSTDSIDAIDSIDFNWSNRGQTRPLLV